MKQNTSLEVMLSVTKQKGKLVLMYRIIKSDDYFTAVRLLDDHTL